MSESVEMFVLKVSMLQDADEPVPLPTLAQELTVSPVSVNEMSKKLTERGLVNYVPYKGVTLTNAGHKLADQIVRRRELWQSFFEEKLGLDAIDAEDIACRFEHVTPDKLTDRLSLFLDNTPDDIISEALAIVNRNSRRLHEVPVGQRVTVAAIHADAATKAFLRYQGIEPEANVQPLAVSPEGVYLLGVGEHRVTLAETLAAEIMVKDQQVA